MFLPISSHATSFFLFFRYLLWPFGRRKANNECGEETRSTILGPKPVFFSSPSLEDDDTQSGGARKGRTYIPQSSFPSLLVKSCIGVLQSIEEGDDEDFLWRSQSLDALSGTRVLLLPLPLVGASGAAIFRYKTLFYLPFSPPLVFFSFLSTFLSQNLSQESLLLRLVSVLHTGM